MISAAYLARALAKTFASTGACFFIGLLPAHSAGFVVIDAETGYVLNARDENRKAPIASLTKIATAMVAIDWMDLSKNDSSQLVTIEPEAVSAGGNNPVGLRAGDRMTLRDLLYCALLQSDNIAAAAISHYVGRHLLQSGAQGSSPEGAFVFQMNQLAVKLGMRRTKFINPSGLDVGGKSGMSTAADVARLTRYAIKNSAFRFYVSQKERSVNIQRVGGSDGYALRNTNELLDSMGIDGVKTGRTSLAGDCLVLSSAKDPESRKEGDKFIITPRRLIVVLLNSQSRFPEGAALIREGWQAYDTWAAQGRAYDPRQAL